MGIEFHPEAMSLARALWTIGLVLGVVVWATGTHTKLGVWVRRWKQRRNDRAIAGILHRWYVQGDFTQAQDEEEY